VHLTSILKHFTSILKSSSIFLCARTSITNGPKHLPILDYGLKFLRIFWDLISSFPFQASSPRWPELRGPPLSLVSSRPFFPSREPATTGRAATPCQIFLRRFAGAKHLTGFPAYSLQFATFCGKSNTKTLMSAICIRIWPRIYLF
jgi:hypothetical protein